MPRKSRSRKKKGGAGMFDFLKAGESKSYTKKRCKEYENEITKLEKRIDELKAKQEEYKCLGGDMMTDNPMEQHEPDIEPEPETEIVEPKQVDVEMDLSDEDEEEDEEPQMQPLYKNDAAVEGVLDEVDAPEDRKDDSIDKTITKGLIGGRRRRRKSRRKSKRKSRKRRKSRKKKKSRKRRRRKSRR